MASLFDHIFDSEWRQREDIESLRSHSSQLARRVRRHTGKLEDRIEALEGQMGELALLCRTLITVLRKSGDLDPATFQAVLREIDAEDGVIDGKVTPEGPPEAEPPRSRTRRKGRRRR